MEIAIGTAWVCYCFISGKVIGGADSIQLAYELIEMARKDPYVPIFITVDARPEGYLAGAVWREPFEDNREYTAVAMDNSASVAICRAYLLAHHGYGEPK